jgi:hypothetical protein
MSFQDVKLLISLISLESGGAVVYHYSMNRILTTSATLNVAHLQLLVLPMPLLNENLSMY